MQQHDHCGAPITSADSVFLRLRVCAGSWCMQLVGMQREVHCRPYRSSVRACYVHGSILSACSATCWRTIRGQGRTSTPSCRIGSSFRGRWFWMWAQGEGLAGYAEGAWAKQHKEWQWASEHVLAQAGQPRAAAGPAPTVAYRASSRSAEVVAPPDSPHWRQTH